MCCISVKIGYRFESSNFYEITFLSVPNGLIECRVGHQYVHMTRLWNCTVSLMNNSQQFGQALMVTTDDEHNSIGLLSLQKQTNHFCHIIKL